MDATLILQVTDGPQRGATLRVPTGGASMGRSTDATLHLDDAECSRIHAKFLPEAGNWYIRDNDSTNGVFLNGEKITDQHRLKDGDELKLGVTTLRVELRTLSATNAADTDVQPTAQVQAPDVVDGGIDTVASDRTSLEDTHHKPQTDKSALAGNLVLGLLVIVAIAGLVWVLIPGDRRSPAVAQDAPTTAQAPDETPGAEPPPPPEETGAAPLPVIDEPPIAEMIGEDLPEADPTPPPQPDLDVVPDPADNEWEADAPARADDEPERLDDDDDFLPEMATPEEPSEADRPEEAAADPAPLEGISTDTPTADFLWLDTLPSGAEVELNGELKGTTPLLLEHLPEGRHMVRFIKPHYEHLSKFFAIPHTGIRQTFELRQQDGTCRLTSTPSGAFVQRGPQFIGQTPLVLHGLPPGEHKVQVSHPGYATVEVSITIDAERPTQAQAELVPRTGALGVIAIPGEVDIYVDDLLKATTMASGEVTGQSIPLRLAGFLEGKHQVRAEWQGISSPTVTVEVGAAADTGVRLIVYVPNLEVTLANEQTIQLMKVGETDEALFVITPKREPVRLSRDRIASSRDIPIEEARELLAK